MLKKLSSGTENATTYALKTGIKTKKSKVVSDHVQWKKSDVN